MSSSCFTSNMSCSLSSSSVHLHSQAWQKVRAATGFAGTPNSNRMLCWLCTNFASNFRTVGPTSALLPTLLQTLQQAWPSSYRRCRRMEYSLVYSLAIASILPGSWHRAFLVYTPWPLLGHIQHLMSRVNIVPRVSAPTSISVTTPTTSSTISKSTHPPPPLDTLEHTSVDET